MPKTLLKTDYAKEREARDLSIYKEWTAMTSVKGQSKTMVTKYLMEKYNIHSQGTIYVIRRRVEEKLKEKEATI